MPQLSSLVRIALGSGLLLSLGSACGGQSFSGGDGGDAGSAQGGTSSTAGTTGTAGKGHAGHTTGGSSSAGTGNIGGTNSAGTGNVGGTGTIGGTGTGGAPDYGACNLPSDCAIRGTGCCGVCDSPMLTTADFVAFNRMYAGNFQCGVPLPAAPSSGGTSSAGASAPIACAPCLQPPPGQGTMMYVVPDCVKGECVVEDLRTSPVTACKASDECKVRHGAGCCEGCGSGDQIAVRNDGSFEKLVCSSGPVACPACAPLPTGAIPVCDASTGHCAIAYPATAGTDPTP